MSDNENNNRIWNMLAATIMDHAEDLADAHERQQ